MYLTSQEHNDARVMLTFFVFKNLKGDVEFEFSTGGAERTTGVEGQLGIVVTVMGSLLSSMVVVDKAGSELVVFILLFLEMNQIQSNITFLYRKYSC